MFHIPMKKIRHNIQEGELPTACGQDEQLLMAIVLPLFIDQ